MDLHITVKSALPIGEPQGEFPILASESTTVGMLIRTLCKDNGIRMKSSYTLRNTSQQELRWSSTLRENLVMGGAVLYLHDNAEDDVEIRGMQCNLWWYMSLISLLIGLIGLIAICVLHYKDGLPYYSYGIVMDAGSSHTKLFIYKWNANKYNNTALAEQIHVCSVKGLGISSYELNPEALAPPLRQCLHEAEGIIPKDKYTTTPVFLGATAGMRLIQAVNDSVSNAILTVVRNTISEYKFSFKDPKAQARIISGEEEGLFSWITSNYLSGNFGVKQPTDLKDSSQWLLGATGQGTVGAMDLGGASTQITYFPGPDVKMPKDYTSSRVLYGANFSVYTHSYLCFGINEITRKYKALLVKSENYSTTITNPCGPAGYSSTETYTDVFEAPCTKDSSSPGSSLIDKNATFTFEGTSNVSQCLDTVSELFNFSVPCPYDQCSFNGTYQPPVYGKFYAFSNFVYETSFLNLTTNKTSTTLVDYETAVNTLCRKNWDQVKSMKAVDAEFLPWYCFRGNFILVLLRDAYRFNNATLRNVNFINKLSGTEIGWSLGFMIASSSHLPLDVKNTYLTKTSFALLIVLFIVFVIIAIGFAVFARRYHKLKKRGVYDKLTGYGTM